MKNSKKKKMPIAHPLTETKYDISVGDKFYRNTSVVRRGLSLPDYNIITWIVGEYMGVKYENCGIGNVERTLGVKNILTDSNLNPNCTNPGWIFVGKDSQEKQLT